MKLYGYWRSTTSYRARIALNLKGLAYETVPVNLGDGAQRNQDYLALNPLGGVPSLMLDDGTVLTQSMAILDYLDQSFPTPPLLPRDPVAAAKTRAAAMVIACDIHPLNNLRVMARLKGMGHSTEDAVDWMTDWMQQGLRAYATLLPGGTAFSFGNAPTFADLCLIPQLYNARRWNLDLSGFSHLTEIEARCLSLAAFDRARPEAQPDAT